MTTEDSKNFILELLEDFKKIIEQDKVRIYGLRVFEPPRGKPNPKIGNHGMYQEYNYKNYEDLIAWQFRRHFKLDKPLEGQIMMIQNSSSPIPKSTSQKLKKQKLAKEPTERLYRAKKPDIDNLAKSLNDSLKEVVFHDDNQVVLSLGAKRYREKPCTEFVIVEFPEP